MGTGIEPPPFEWLTLIRQDRDLSGYARLVYYTLWGRGSRAWPSIPTLAADCGISARSVNRAIAELAEAGWLAVLKRTSRQGRASNEYVLGCPGKSQVRATEARTTTTQRREPPRHRGAGSPKDLSPKGGDPKMPKTYARNARKPGPGQAPLDGLAVLPVPDPPGADLEIRSEPPVPTARDVVAAYCDGASDAGMPTPAKKSIGRVGKDAKAMLASGEFDPAELVDAAYQMGHGPWDDLDRQIRVSRVGNTGRRFGAAANATAGLELLSQLREMEASGQ